MNQAPKSLKDIELQRYYDRLFEMHGSAGWAELMRDIEFMEGEHNKVDTVDDERTLFIRKGELNMIRWLKTHKERTEAAYAHMIEEQEGDGAAPEPTGGVAKVVRDFSDLE